jgi:glutamine---fructose-6-phosphate transaminase (isomerizing)
LFSTGIFAFLNYGVAKSRLEVTKILVNGLKRLEYRGYDSAGLCVDDNNGGALIVREVGPVAQLEKLALASVAELDSKPLDKHVGIAHTRWATHGPVCVRNSHPHTSSPNNEFVVIHNGVITNYKDIKATLEKKGYTFYSETDTEVVAKLALYVYNELKASGEKFDFKKVVLQVTSVVQGAYAFIFKSPLFPGEVCAAKRGSPLIMGVKSSQTRRVEDQVIEVTFGDEAGFKTYVHNLHALEIAKLILMVSSSPSPKADASAGATNLSSLASQVVSNLTPETVEYFLASDTSAIIEHTKYDFGRAFSLPQSGVLTDFRLILAKFCTWKTMMCSTSTPRESFASTAARNAPALIQAAPERSPSSSWSFRASPRANLSTTC